VPESPAAQNPTAASTAGATTPQSEPNPAAGASSVSPWWLLAVVAAVVTVVAVVVSGRRRRHWDEQLHAAEAEVKWFAGVLLPELRAADTLDRAMGGWQVSSERVRAAEDQITVLEGSARDETGRLRARTLRDAVRRARGRLESLSAPGVHESWRLDLEAAVDELLTALGRAPQPH
jgi:hypothetical protein